MDKLSPEEELADRQVVLTHFGRALEELGIGHVPSRSPQARGRVAAAQPELAFTPPPNDLKFIICPKHDRKVSNGSTISYEDTTYQLIAPAGSVASLQPKAKATSAIATASVTRSSATSMTTGSVTGSRSSRPDHHPPA